MHYALTRMVLGSSGSVTLSDAEYKTIEAAMNGLLEYSSIEEKFDLVRENHLELEMALIEAAAQRMLQSGQDHRWFNEKRRLFNRRLMNFLSSARAYTDHVPQHFNRIFAEDKLAAQTLKAAFSREYDNRLGYRCMEALRNHAQHAGDPVHGAVYPAAWVGAREKMRFSAEPYLSPTELAARGNFKASVLKELEAKGNQISFKNILRDYVEGLCTAHAELRQRVGHKYNEWTTTIRGSIESFRSQCPDESSIIGLAAVIHDDEWCVSCEIPIVVDFLDYIDYLINKNYHYQNLTKAYATSEAVT